MPAADCASIYTPLRQTMALHPVTADLLERLLERAERPNRRTVVRVRLHEIVEYAKTDRPQVHTELAALANQGYVQLHWIRFEEGNWLESVDLVTGQAGPLNEMLGRTTRAERLQALSTHLAQIPPVPGWHSVWLDDTHAALAAGRVPTPFAASAAADDQDLVAALTAVARLRAPMLERRLSASVLGDSKRFEALRTRVAGVLRRYSTLSQELDSDERSVLAAHWIERVPEHVLVFGPLTLSFAQQHVELQRLGPSIGLAPAFWRQARLLSNGARLILTIENLTPFAGLAELAPVGVVGVFTGGFASPTVLDLVRRCRTNLGLIHYHWGDIDPAGFQILAHLRHRLGRVAALLMDDAVLQTHRALTRPLPNQAQTHLKRLLHHPRLTDCQAALARLQASTRGLDQEVIPLDQAVGQLISAENVDLYSSR